MEGTEEVLYWHNSGIVDRSGSTSGTAVAVRFNTHCLLLTALHVINRTPNEDLGFFFRPSGRIKRTDCWQDHPPSRRVAPPLQVRIFERFENPKLDLAALVVSPSLDRFVNIRFFDLLATVKLPREMPSVVAIGFPPDSVRKVGPNSAIVAAPIWGAVEKGKESQPDNYQPRRHLLLRFWPAAIGKRPRGFSGAGVWYHHQRAQEQNMWTPNVCLAGMVTDYYPQKHILRILRVEKIARFLDQICPAK